jgi:hypothetical protein
MLADCYVHLEQASGGRFTVAAICENWIILAPRAVLSATPPD